MIYGKAEFRIGNGEGKTIWLTVTGGFISIKQGGDLVKLDYEAATEFQQDLAAGLEELRAQNAAGEQGRGAG